MALIDPENISAQANGFSRLPVLRQLGLMFGLAASVALGVAVVLWSQSPNYSVLYSNLTEKDSSQVVEALQKAGIDFKVDPTTGAIMVAGGKVRDARLKLAAEGLPNGTNNGYEILDKQEKFGVSQLMETARYQRALEGELARTIATLGSVESARVHLAIPKQSVFVRHRKPPSASVVLKLYPGRALDIEQVQAVVHLVASSIPNLDSGKVTVVDEQGRLLTSRDAARDGIDASQIDYLRRLEERYIKRIEDIITPIVGLGGVKAQVTAEVDFTMTERTQETFNPDRAAVRSEQRSEERSGGGPTTGGIPGALANQPPVGGSLAPVAGAGAAAEATGGDNRRVRSTRNFELDKTISHTRLATGTIRRLSVAVVVDDRRVVSESGEVSREPLGEEELARLTALVRDAVGYNAQRGDNVNVINSTFSTPPEPEPLPAPPLWEQPWLWDAGKQVGGVALVLLLVFGVLRPVLRELAAKGAPLRSVTVNADGEAVALEGPGGERRLPGPGGANVEERMGAARALATQDPRRVAQVVNQWVQED